MNIRFLLSVSTFLLLGSASAFAEGCGNTNQGGPSAPPCDCSDPSTPPNGTGNPFVPFSGTTHRQTQDLEVYGAVGVKGLSWERHAMSRPPDGAQWFGEGHFWRHSWQWDMTITGWDGAGNPEIELDYPDGHVMNFTFSSGATWKCGFFSGDLLIKNSSTQFTLQKPDATRYVFTRPSTSALAFTLQNRVDAAGNVTSLAYDGSGRLSTVTEPAGRTLTITYSTHSFTNQNGSAASAVVIDKVTSSDGREVDYSYGTFNDLGGVTRYLTLTGVTYPDGTAASYSYWQWKTARTPLLQTVDEPHAVGGSLPHEGYTYLNSQFNVNGQVLTEVNPISGAVVATLSNPGSDVAKVSYSNGAVETFNVPVAQNGHLQSRLDGLNHPRTYTSDNSGKGFVIAYTDENGKTTNYTRTIQGSLLMQTNPDASSHAWTRDSLDRTLTETDENGKTTTTTRDSFGRPTRIDYPDTTFETYTYNAFGEVTSHQLQNGGTESFAYDARGLKTSMTDAMGNTTSYTYDGSDQLASITDPNNHTTVYQYDATGHLLQVTHPDGTTISYSYDACGNQLAMTNELGKVWTWTYDEFNRKLTETDPLGRTTSWHYGLPGAPSGCSSCHADDKPTLITLPSGKQTAINYDLDWQKISQTDGYSSSDAATTSWTWDPAHNNTSATDANGHATHMTYDSRNRTLTKTDPLGNQTSWTYDGNGNVLTVMRPDGGVTANVYDSLNRLTKSTDAKSQVTQYAYDAEGNMATLTDANSHRTTFTYDGDNRKTRKSYADGTHQDYTYDGKGNLLTFTTCGSQVQTFSYDNRDRETGFVWSDGVTPSVGKTYDAASRLTGLSSSVSTLSYTYDDANEKLSEAQNVVSGTGTTTVAYSYDADGNRASLTYPDGTVLSYAYTNREQIKTISAGGPPPVVSYAYDLVGNTATKTLANGTIATSAYDADNRLTSLIHTSGTLTFASFQYGYNSVSDRTYVKHQDGKGNVFSYDAVDQVTGVQYQSTNPDTTPSAPARTVGYALDPVGNWTGLTDSVAGTTSFTANNLNQYTAVNATTPAYDANGNLTGGLGTFIYDAQNRLTSATVGSNVITFAYDALNRCVSRTINGNKKYLVYDSSWRLLTEQNTSGATLNDYIEGVGLDEMLEKYNTTSALFYHQDGLGSVARLTDGSGNIIESYYYDIYGTPTIKNAGGTVLSSTAYGNRFLFTGREYLADVNLYDFRNRMYSPQLGRWLSRDPIGERAGLNIYAYVFNCAVNLVDPLGKDGVNTFYNPAPPPGLVSPSSPPSQPSYFPSNLPPPITDPNAAAYWMPASSGSNGVGGPPCPCGQHLAPLNPGNPWNNTFGGSPAAIGMTGGAALGTGGTLALLELLGWGSSGPIGGSLVTLGTGIGALSTSYDVANAESVIYICVPN